MGFSLDAVIAMATNHPAKVIGRVEKLGTLQPGAPADVAILKLVDAPVTFADTRNNARVGKTSLQPVLTIRGGVPFGRPYPAPPFAFR
jgi:dihydroorotase